MTPEDRPFFSEEELLPVVREALCDLDTPLAIYLKLASCKETFFLESVMGGERFGRYTILGLSAFERLEAWGKRIRIFQEGACVFDEEIPDPWAFIASWHARARTPALRLPLRFSGGIAGYLGYDMVRFIETKLAPAKPREFPDALLLRTESLAVIDNVTSKVYFIAYARQREGQSGIERAEKKLNHYLDLLSSSCLPPQRQGPLGEAVWVEDNPSKADYLDMVAEAKKAIVEGEIFQVQLGVRKKIRYSAPPLDFYRALRRLNPSPYLFYFDFGDFRVMGSSPEILVRLEGDVATLRPIAGTRRRGNTPEEDIALEQELLHDPKERAEHVMLIDLARNDLGRVAQAGTVRVTETMAVERYSHVMHMVSNVVARLSPGMGPFSLLRATFPAGTVTGAPKVRAMELIDALEPMARGIYAGAVGYLGFEGNMDWAIAIRTAILRGQELFVQASAGIVHDSVAEAEWQEVQNKAQALVRAAEIAARGK